MLTDGVNRRIRSGRIGPFGVGKPSPDPPADFDWQPVTMTAAEEGQWEGFSDGGETRPQPAFGSISGQPSTVTNLLALYDDTASNVYLAVFSGEWLPQLAVLPLNIGGFEFTPFDAEIISGNTWIRYNGAGDWADGANYEVEFG